MNWPVATIEEAFEFVRNGKNIKQDKSAGGLPITRIETIANGNIDAGRLGYAGLEISGNEKWLLQPGDILFSHINSVDHVGKCALYNGDPDLLLHGMNLLAMRPRKRVLDPNYALLALRDSAFRSELLPFINKAVNQASVSTTNLKTLQIPLPPLEEQRRIAAILDKADQLRQKRKKAIDLLDSLTQSIFLEMFGDLRDEIEMPFAEIADDEKMGLVRSAAEIGQEHEIPYLRMDGITSSGNLDLKVVKRTKATPQELQTYELRFGDFLFNTRNSKELVGKSTVYVGPPGHIYNNNILRVRFKKMANPFFLAAYFQTVEGKRKLEERKSGTTSVFAIYQKSLNSLSIPIPPTEKQAIFAARIGSVAQSKAAMAATETKFQNLFSSLQHRAFAGEL